MNSAIQDRLRKLQTQNNNLQRQLEALQHDLDYHKRLVEGVRDGLWHRDIVKDALSVSPRWWKALGYKPEEVPDSVKSLWKCIHPDDLSKVKEALEAHIVGDEREYRCEFRLRDGNGDYRTILSRGVCLKGENKQPKYIVGSHTDITDLRNQNEAVARRFSMFELIFKSIPHLILVKDSSGRFIFVNEALAQFYSGPKAAPEDLIGKCDADFNQNADQVATFRMDDKWVIDNKKTRTIPKERNTDFANRRHWLNTIKVPLINEDGTVHVVVVATYIDDVIALQERIRKHQEREQLAAKLNHKLGTRIFTLQNYSAIITFRDDEEKQNVMEAIDDLNAFSKDFLTLSTANKIHPQSTNLMAILHRAFHPFKKQADITVNGAGLTTRMEKTRRYDMRADETKLLDVFSELAKNSLKWARSSPDRHRIEIHTDVVWVRVEGMATDPDALKRPAWLRLTIRDNGRGIKRGLRKTLFDLFVSGTSEGTGLGLAIAKEVIESHGGTIREISKPGQGACFEIKLPVTPIQQTH